MNKAKTLLLTIILAASSIAASAQATRHTIEQGVQTSMQQSANHQWREAFATCRNLDALAANDPELQYLVSAERFRLYCRINKNVESKAQLNLMETYARSCNKANVIEEMLMKKAWFAYTHGNHAAATACYREIIDMRTKGKDLNAREQCYKDMIAKAKTENNDIMASLVDKMYKAWSDSIAEIRRAEELTKVNGMYEQARKDIESKGSTISSQRVIIGLLIAVAIGLAAGLAFFVLVMMRNVKYIKKLKKNLKMSELANKQKNECINNISRQLKPSLQALSQGNPTPHVNAINRYLANIETYIRLDQSLNEHYAVGECQLGKICNAVIDELKPTVAEGVGLNSGIHADIFSTNEEALHTLLRTLLQEIVKDRRVERINLEFKRRNTHTGHLIVTAVGMTMSEDKHNHLFEPFKEVADLTQDDGLTYPTCSLMARKLGGEMQIDEEFKRGTRFVIILKG